MAWIKTDPALGYLVSYIANGVDIKKRVKKGEDCILVAPEVSRVGWSFRGWRADTVHSLSVLPSKICDGKGIILYAVWSKTVQHGGSVSAGPGYWGYDTRPDGSGFNWSGGTLGYCDKRCGNPNCGVSYYYIWTGSGHNEPIIDIATGQIIGYSPKPDWHGQLSGSWSTSDTSVDVG